MTDLLAEQYAMALENAEPCNYTRIPNIIDHLTYDAIDEKTGETIVKRLSVYAKELYRIIKTVSGQTNVCWMTAKNLAELANMSQHSVCEAKKELQQKFHQLDGNPLIEITEKKKCTKRGDEKINGTHFHQIVVKDIWGFNRAYFFLKKVEKEEARSPHDHAEGRDRHTITPPFGARSPHDRNKTDCSKTPLFKKQHSTAPPNSVCSSSTENSVSCSEEQNHSFNWLTRNGCNVPKAVEIATRFTTEELKKSIEYTEIAVVNARKKMKTLANPIAYLIKTLENRYWETQKV